MNQEIAEQAVNAFGISVLIRVKAPVGESVEYAEGILHRLTSAWTDSPFTGDAQEELLTVDLGEVTEERFERVHSLMSTEVTLAALKHHAGKLMMLHAGGIARADGKVVVITGPSGRGKTTTLSKLGRHYGYVSDETVAIDFDGNVLPYRKPLSVISEGHKDKLQIPPSQLGLKPLPEQPLTLAGIAILERAGEGTTESTVTDLGFGAGLVASVEQSSYLINLDQPLTRYAELAASVGGFKQLTVGLPDQIHMVAEELFVPSAAPYWLRMMPSEPATDGSKAAYLPGDIVDAVECDDGTVVFARSSKVVLLDGIGPEIWRSVCNEDSWDELVTHIEAEHGPAPDNDTGGVIMHVANELIEAGILVAGTGIPTEQK